MVVENSITAQSSSTGGNNLNEGALETLLLRSGRFKSLAFLLQFASGSHLPLLDLTYQHHSSYAEQHHMTYIAVRGQVHTLRHPTWNKILLIRALLQMKQCEYLFWLDGDALITCPEQDLREALPQNKWLGMATHNVPHLPSHQNAGVLYVRNTPEAIAFFDAVWDTWPVLDNWGEDQAGILKVLADATLRSGLELLPDKWNSTVNTNMVSDPVVMAWHGTRSAEERLVDMQEVLAAVLAGQRVFE